jgi:hypothetical protein
MPAKLRLEAHRSLEISMAKLSPRIGCGLMLTQLPRLDAADPLLNAMNNYGYTTLHADKTAQKLVQNSGLLKQFFDNAFVNKLALRQNYRDVYGHLELYMALDPTPHTSWFIAEPPNRIALQNYYRDALTLGLKPLGILLLGSTIRLTSSGWQNLYDLLTDKFFNAHPGIQRVEVMSAIGGVRWRSNCLGLGVMLLNFRELPEIQTAVEAALTGATGPEIQN